MKHTAPEFALKEWAVVCDLLTRGAMCLLPRKGGIREWGGPGVFALEHDEFFLFPTREHEKLERIKPEFLALAPVDPAAVTSEYLTVEAVAKAERIWIIPSRVAFDRLDAAHPWLPPAIDMRFDYKPENPLYLVALRVRRLAAPKRIAQRESYRGCRSWVPLLEDDRPSLAGAVPAMSDAEFGAVVAAVDAAFAG